MLKRILQTFIILSSLVTMSFSADFSISSVYVKKADRLDHYKVALDATIQMSKAQVDVLENGIPLTFSYMLTVEEKVGLTWAEGDNKPKLYNFKVAYNALTQQYVVSTLRGKKYENFPTLSLALAYIAEPKNLKVEIVDREANGIYRGGVRLRLDINELPTPLRIPAYLSKEWRLDSGWKYWEFDPW